MVLERTTVEKRPVVRRERVLLSSEQGQKAAVAAPWNIRGWAIMRFFFFVYSSFIVTHGKTTC